MTNIFIEGFLGAIFGVWMFPILTEGSEGQTYGHKRWHDGQFWHHNGHRRGARAGPGRHGRREVKTRTSLSLQTRLNI